jgi:hypothetical protein
MPQLAEVLAGIKDAGLLANYLNNEGKLLIDDIDKNFVEATTTQELPPGLISSYLRLELPKHTALPAGDLERACDAAVALAKHTPASQQLETQVDFQLFTAFDVAFQVVALAAPTLALATGSLAVCHYATGPAC